MSRETLDRSALRELLGLRPEATDAEIHEACRELEEFLAPRNVPRRLQVWAARERAAIALALAESRQTSTASPRAAHAPVSTADPRASARQGATRPSDLPDFFDEDLAPETPRPRPRRPSAVQPALRAPARRRSQSSGLFSLRSVVLILALGVVVAIAIVESPLLGGRGGEQPVATPGASQAAAPLDQARVAELVRLVQANPSDTAALFELGEMHFQADRWPEAIDWFTKLLAIDPSNTHARTDVGTASYNLGRYEDAKNAWEEVARRDPSDAQVHYNLGFLYANGPEPSLDKALAEWQKVVEIAPDSAIGQTAKTHLQALRK